MQIDPPFLSLMKLVIQLKRRKEPEKRKKKIKQEEISRGWIAPRGVLSQQKERRSDGRKEKMKIKKKKEMKRRKRRRRR
ncbi:hypothetical protein CSUI_007195 [Cystoisospora suis]|uniref:Uncharacterized protein n=1 Tax=Cystoisospora suis TaxID=483139 RepID=A0A2C6KQX5_9APIC|nr:hypothetical protein CSUI_007195 [Cystoisospora suis]